MFLLFRAFITQYSRSLHFEYLNTGIDILVVTPFYFVSNKYRKNVGTLFAPLPDVILRGAFSQLGKKGVYQVHAYWYHCIIGRLQEINPFAPYNAVKRMEEHREKYKKKLLKEQQQEQNNSKGKNQ